MWKILSLTLLLSSNILAVVFAADQEAHSPSSDGENEEEFGSNLEQVRTGLTYTVGAFPVNWYQAGNLCAVNSSTLAKVADVQDFGNIVSFLFENDLDGRNFWLGANRAFGSWFWFDNTRLSVKQWARGEPRSRSGSCLQLRSDFKLYAGNCFSSQLYICEKSG